VRNDVVHEVNRMRNPMPEMTGVMTGVVREAVRFAGKPPRLLTKCPRIRVLLTIAKIRPQRRNERAG